MSDEQRKTARFWPFTWLARRRAARVARLLEALNHHGELSGIELQALTQLPTDSFFVLTQRLEDDGHLASRWGPPIAERGYRRKRLYRLNRPEPV